MNSRLTFAVFLHTLFSTCSHYHITVLNSLEPFVKSFANRSISSHYGYVLSESNWSWIWAVINAVLAVGCVASSPFISIIIHYFGRRNTVMVVKNFFFITSCLLQFVSRPLNSVELLIIGRFLYGFCHPLALLTPTFVAECAPTKYRGLASTANNVGSRIWLIFGPIVALPWLLGSEQLWHWTMFVTIIPALLHLLATYFIPKSPKNLYILHNDVDNAIKSLKWYHGEGVDTKSILEEFDEERNLAVAGERTSLRTILQTRHLCWPFFLSFLIWVAMPFSGIALVNLYSTPVMISIGIKQENASLFTALVLQAPCLVVSLICTLIVEKCGRKILYLSGYGMVIIGLCFIFFSSFISATNYSSSVISIAGMSLMLNGYSLGPILSLMLPSELCPAAIKAKTAAISQVFSHILFAISIFAFPPLYSLIGSYVLLPLVCISILIWLFVFVYFPETKGKTPEEIAVKWMR